jgi:cytoskeletal protein CcmA (bactofilin family)
MALKILAEQVHYANVDLNHNQLNNARIQNLSAEPTSNNAAGRIFYDTDTNQIKVYNGSAFVQLVTETTDSNDITDVESILNTSLVVGRDAHNQIKFSTDDQIIFRVGNADGVTFKASGEIEATSLDISGDVDIDGTLETDALSIASTTVSSTAAELNLVDGSSAGTIVNSKAVIYGSSGEVNATTLQIGGTSITATAAELNVNDGVTAGTVAASKVVVVDSNKDIASFRNVTLTGELDAATLDISGDADIDGTLEADAITVGGTNIVSGSVITTLGTITQSEVSFATDTLEVASANANDPLVIIKNTTNDANGARLRFVKDKGAAGADGDDVGIIEFVGDDAAQTQTTFGKVLVEVGEADNTDEAGTMTLQVASSDGTTTGLRSGLVLTGHKTSQYVDVTLGSGSASTVTIPGNLTVSGTTTTVNSTTVNLNDHNIILDSGNSTSAVVDGAGITIEGGSGDDATFTYNTTGPKFELKLGSSYEDLQVDQLIAASLDISGDVDVDGTLETDALSINGTAVTSTAAELNLLDGITTLSGSNTGDEPDASTSVKGIVELATSAETITGTDTARAVTPDGLAARSVVATIAQSSLTDDKVDHNLNTRDVIVQLYDVSSYDTVIADVVRTTVDRVTITFASAPSSNDIRVLVTKID